MKAGELFLQPHVFRPQLQQLLFILRFCDVDHAQGLGNGGFAVLLLFYGVLLPGVDYWGGFVTEFQLLLSAADLIRDFKCA